MDVEAELLKSMTKDELDAEVKIKIDSFHGFLTREVALKLIAKEKGLLKEEEKTYLLAKIPKGQRKVSFTAQVKKIWPIATYGSGKRSRVIEIKDESGQMPLILWNQDTELAKGLHPRDMVKVRGAYERNNELHLSYSGKLEIVSKASFPALQDLKEGEIVHVRGLVSAIEGIDSFVSGTQTRKAFSFLISDGKTEQRAVMWGNTERGKTLNSGDEVLIEDALINNGNIEISSDARILVRRLKNMLIGQIRKLECINENLLADVDGKEIKLDRENALRFIGVEAADDIALETVVSLKRDSLLNNQIAIKIEEKDGQIYLRG